MSNSLQCGALLTKRTAGGRRPRCAEQATRIRRIYPRVALLVCNRHAGVDEIDIAEDSLIDLLELPPHFRSAALVAVQKQRDELRLEIARLQRMVDRLDGDATLLAQEQGAGS
jgi:hypothetical protein